MRVNTYRIWARGFISLCVLIAVFGIITTFLGLSGIAPSKYIGVASLSGSRASLVLSCVVLGTCLIGLGFAKRKLLRIGLLFQAGSRALAALGLLVVLSNGTIQIPLFPVGSYSFLYVQEGLGVLSLVCFSYGLARWQSSDRIFLAVQVLLAVGFTGAIMRRVALLSPSSSGIYLQLSLVQFLMLAGIVSLVFRPACWKVHPLITLCLTAGGAVSQFVGNVLFSVLPDVLAYQLSFGSVLFGDTLFLLGVLLFIQVERVDWYRTARTSATSSSSNGSGILSSE